MAGAMPLAVSSAPAVACLDSAATTPSMKDHLHKFKSAMVHELVRAGYTDRNGNELTCIWYGCYATRGPCALFARAMTHYDIDRIPLQRHDIECKPTTESVQAAVASFAAHATTFPYVALYSLGYRGEKVLNVSYIVRACDPEVE